MTPFFNLKALFLNTLRCKFYVTSVLHYFWASVLDMDPET